MSKEKQLQDFMVGELGIPVEALTSGDDLIATHVIDSLGLMQIVAFMEGEFSVDIPDDALVADHFASISSMVRLVESRLPTPA